MIFSKILNLFQTYLKLQAKDFQSILLMPSKVPLSTGYSNLENQLLCYFRQNIEIKNLDTRSYG